MKTFVLFGRPDLPEVDVEAVGEGEVDALLRVRLDLLVVGLRLLLVRREDHDDVGRPRRLGDGEDLEPRALGLPPGVAPLAEPDHDVVAGVLQVVRVRVPLAAVADDGDPLPLELRRVRVPVVVDLKRH
jgi:hypothetical protein